MKFQEHFHGKTIEFTVPKSNKILLCNKSLSKSRDASFCLHTVYTKRNFALININVSLTQAVSPESLVTQTNDRENECL